MRRRIVVVEDDDSLGTVIKDTLDEAGYDAVAFTDLESAIRDVESHGAALILTDLTLGAQDGRELIQRVRERFGDTVPIVVISGWDLALVNERLPVRDVLAKPFDLTQLEATVAQWVAP